MKKTAIDLKTIERNLVTYVPYMVNSCQGKVAGVLF